MIQDIAPHTYHNEYKPSAPDKDSLSLHTKRQYTSSPPGTGCRYYFPTFPGVGGKDR